MPIVHRSDSTVASASRTNTTVTAPAGAAPGDVIVVALSVGGNPGVTPTAPSGWTQIGAVTYSQDDPWTVHHSLWLKVFDEAASWTWTHAARVSQAYTVAWSGVDVTTPLDVAATTAVGLQGGASPQTSTAPSLTTVTDGARLILARGSWNGNAATPPSGWTERLDAPVVWVGDRDFPTAGSVGSVSIASGNTEGFLQAWGIIMAALRPATEALPSGLLLLEDGSGVLLLESGTPFAYEG